VEDEIFEVSVANGEEVDPASDANPEFANALAEV